jgi:hypothetical protein
MTAQLRPLPFAAAREPGIRSPHIGGDWPPELRKSVLQTPRATLSFYTLPDTAGSGHCLAVDWVTHTVYVWSCTGVT